MTEIALVAGGTYGIATIVADYDGPFGVFERLRRSRLAKLFACNVCLMPYAAIPLALGLDVGLYGYLAAIGLGVILARLT